MIKQEFNELYDSLYYGHDAELTIAGKHYFLEWNDAGIELYLMVNGEGTKNLNNSHADFEIVDIE